MLLQSIINARCHNVYKVEVNCHQKSICINLIFPFRKKLLELGALASIKMFSFDAYQECLDNNKIQSTVS